MSAKRFLSEKKTTNQNISISPALKDWIERYIKRMHDQFPTDERYASVSAFYCYIMERMLKFFEKGNTLEDINKVMDQQSPINRFLDEFTFKAAIALHEDASEAGRYTDIDFSSQPLYFMTYRTMFLNTVDPYDFNSVQSFVESFRKFFLGNKLTREFKINFNSKKDKPHYYSGVFEYAFRGNPNLFYVNIKFNAVIFGSIGVRFKDFYYSEKDLYCRTELETTDLFFEPKFMKKERIKLMSENLQYVTNYNQVLNDKDFYLWMKLAENKGIHLFFKDNTLMSNIISKLEEDILKYGERENFIIKMLGFFEKIHWIRILNKKELSFQFEFPIGKNAEEIEFFSQYFSKNYNLIENKDTYYLNKK